MKLHGSLDVFAYNDCKDFLRVHPEHDTIDGWIRAIESVEQHLPARYMERRIPVEGKICVYDDASEMQFLRRTPVAGAFKFDRHGVYNAPGELVDFFAHKLDDFDEIVVIGYSWGDPHLNTPIERWLNADPKRRIVNVDPAGLPSRAGHIRPRVDVRTIPATEYIATFLTSPIDPALQQLRELRLLGRRVEDSTARFQEALLRVMHQRAEDVVAWVGRQTFTGKETREDLERRLAAELRFGRDQILEQVIRQMQALVARP